MTHLSQDLKIRAIQHFLANQNYVETSELFQVPRTTLMRWVEKYQDHQSLTRKKRNYTAYKVHQKYITKAKELLRRNPAITMNQIVETLKEEFDDFDVHSVL